MLMINEMRVHFVWGFWVFLLTFFLVFSYNLFTTGACTQERALCVHTAALKGVILTDFALSMCRRKVVHQD